MALPEENNTNMSNSAPMVASASTSARVPSTFGR
ncbi:Uncharacterised protein [Mycobacteroides abscessus subsp. abscessus]|nr:Uncharacterised protein [Mycobacteroides abscessus subsp. abscessus]